MIRGLEARPDDADTRLVGVLRLLNALIGIRLRSASDPESRRHLIWLNDIIAAVGLLSQRLATGRLADFTVYLQSAVDFWRRSATDCEISLHAPAQPVSLSNLRAACLAIIAHELLGASISRETRPGGGKVAVRLDDGPDGVFLSVEDDGAGAPTPAADESLELVRGMAEHLGGSVEVTANGRRTITIRLGPDSRASHPH